MARTPLGGFSAPSSHTLCGPAMEWGRVGLGCAHLFRRPPHGTSTWCRAGQGPQGVGGGDSQGRECWRGMGTQAHGGCGMGAACADSPAKRVQAPCAGGRHGAGGTAEAEEGRSGLGLWGLSKHGRSPAGAGTPGSEPRWGLEALAECADAWAGRPAVWPVVWSVGFSAPRADPDTFGEGPGHRRWGGASTPPSSVGLLWVLRTYTPTRRH